MADPATFRANEESARQDAESLVRPSQRDESERRLPFTARVAVTWFTADELAGPEDGELGYWQRAPMTGNIVSTSAGRDVSFSDLEVT